MNLRKTKTDEEFAEEVRISGNGEYEPQSRYEKSGVKVLMLHKVCGTVYPVRPMHFLAGKRCPTCFSIRKKTDEEFLEQVQLRGNGDYEPQSPYQGASTKIQMLHKVCGGVYPVKPNTFLNGHRCPYCAGNQRITQAEFEQRVLEKLGPEYKVEGNYVSESQKVAMLHLPCGHRYKVAPSHIINHGKKQKPSGCPKCSGKMKRTTSGYKQEVEEQVAQEYLVLGEYVTALTPIRMKHVTCGTEYDVKPSDFLGKGRRCPRCSRSKGEQAVAAFLESQSLCFNDEHTFDDCRDKGLLRFDFFVEEPRCLIEFDGIQHFEPVTGRGGKKTYAGIHKRDNIKNRYCFERHIPLVRIPYWHLKKVESILNHALPFLEEFQPLFQILDGSTVFQLMLEKASEETDPEKRTAYECFLKPYGYVAGLSEQQESEAFLQSA